MAKGNERTNKKTTDFLMKNDEEASSMREFPPVKQNEYAPFKIFNKIPLSYLYARTLTHIDAYP